MPTTKKKRGGDGGRPVISAGGLYDVVDEILKGWDYLGDKPIGHGLFRYYCIVAGRPEVGPMHPRWETMIEICDAQQRHTDKLRKVLNHEPIGAGPHYFIFPDRWLTPGDAQGFTWNLLKNPDVKKFDYVAVVTHQPYIVGDFRKEQVKMITQL